MAVPQAPTLALVDTTETNITLKFSPLEDLTLQYILEWKEYPAPDYASSKTGISAEDAKLIAAEPLEPGKTYCVRLVATDSAGNKGEPCKELIIDTEQVGCTPKADKGCCAIS
mmetsp:Transcript_9513/g.12584  ORF Transcript_9513/g.12584 Transcript_9513/m.12584 type:complete len:113 (+) Transcript_9513:134-472(+)|eukprot:CAMPEP_0198143524 /NCGR_PEP_ID=MMETSP1443-20131203/8323_1 /TAXON_ID=186043 /ORGANISM="Entomoneis sp., Strain CCMP2396" /LENGTH=112 /DNA_ID=CAMNT_0043806775 /DNA_START=44 /DNA_END=382 /DNA_ORIENTATION=-